MWLTNTNIPEYWFPAKCKMVLTWLPRIAGAGPELDRPPVLEINVDRGFPNRWREEPWHSDIRGWARYMLSQGGQTYIVRDGFRRWLVLPDKEVACTGAPGMVVRVGDGEWGFIECKSEEQVLEMHKRMQQMQEWMAGLSARDRMQLLLEMEADGYVTAGLVETKLKLAKEIMEEAENE